MTNITPRSLPSLESVAINLIDASHEAVNVLQAFFSRHGTELRHITFQGQGMVHTQRWSTPLLDCYPNLESLDVQSNSLVSAESASGLTQLKVLL